MSIKPASGTASSLTLAVTLTIAALACGPPFPHHLPPQAPASLSGPAFDKAPLYPDEGDPSEGPVVVHVLHTNDMHGQVHPRKARWLNKVAPPDVGGVNALGGYIEKVREEVGEDNLLLLDSGDIFAGTPEGNLTKGQIMIEIMNSLSYDAMALGNHEFDQGVGVLKGLADKAEFPILAANIYSKSTPEGEKVSNSVVPVTIIEKAGVRFGIIGAISKRTPEMTHRDAASAFDFEDPLTGITDAIGTLKAEGVDAIIVLSHVGRDEELPIIDALSSPVVAVLGGHSHSHVDPMVRSEKTGIVYLQTGGKTASINHLVLKIHGKKVSAERGGPVLLLSSEWDTHTEVTEIVARYSPKIEKTMSETVGKCREALTRTRGEIGSSSLGNYVTDVMRKASGADVAITNKTGIRANLDPGPVTVRSLYEVAPFDNSIVTVKLTGAQLKEVMEYAGATSRTYLEISGATVSYDLDKPEGQRVVGIKVKGKAVKGDATYSVATNSFLADGGDGHETFTRGARTNTDTMLRDALIDALRKSKTCPNPTEARILSK